MKRNNRFVILILLVLFLSSASCAEESFSFRNGIHFGMTSEELIQTEKENEQVDENEWENFKLGNWIVLGPEERIAVSQYEAYLRYLLADDHMQAAIYLFSEDTSVPSETEYQYICYALSTVYGEADTVLASEVVTLVDEFERGGFHESDIKEAYKWAKTNVVIYQFYYGKEDFIILYSNPNYDYSSFNSRFVNVTGL